MHKEWSEEFQYTRSVARVAICWKLAGASTDVSSILVQSQFDSFMYNLYSYNIGNLRSLILYKFVTPHVS